MASESEWVEFIGFENEDMERAWDQGAEQSVQWWVHFFLSTSSAGSKPCLKRDYWSKFHFLVCHLKKCQEINSRRFGSIYHLNNCENLLARGDQACDKLFKVCPLSVVISHIYQRIQAFKICFHHEAMVKYKGRLGFKQYMLMKPVKRGI